MTSNYTEPLKVLISFSLSDELLRQCQVNPTEIKPSQPDDVMSPKTKLYVFTVPKTQSAHILENYTRLLNDHRYSDFNLVVQNYRFRCHKAILAAHCTILVNLIELNGESDTLVLDSFNVETIADLLQYIYADQTPNIKNTAADLLLAADKFELKSLTSTK